MIHTNYPNLLKTIISRNRGFWRLDAISRLTKGINKGLTHLEYLKNLITRYGAKNQIYSFLEINPIKTFNKKINEVGGGRNKISQTTFFVTQIQDYNRIENFKYNNKIFLNKYEENLYNPIELHPFEIKYIRQRNENQKYFNVQEIKKEIERNYNYIRKRQTKDRPFSSYYNNKLNQNLFGYERKNSSLNIRNYYRNNRNMNKKRKSANTINLNGIDNTTKEKWKNPEEKKRLLSAYLNNREKGNIIGEENELFEKIKQIKFNNNSPNDNFSTKNKTMDNFSTLTDISNTAFQKRGLSGKHNFSNNINKDEINGKKFSSLNSEKTSNKRNLFSAKSFKNIQRKINSAKMNKNVKLKQGNNIKLNYFNNNYKEKNPDFILFKKEDSTSYINKKSKVIKIK